MFFSHESYHSIPVVIIILNVELIIARVAVVVIRIRSFLEADIAFFQSAEVDEEPLNI